MQNTFPKSGNDSKWFSKKSFFRIGMWNSSPPPFMEKNHLKFPFWLFESLPKQFCLRGGFDVPYSRFFHERSIQKTFDISIYFHILSIYTVNLGKMSVDSNEWCLLCLCLLLPSGYSEHLDWRWPGRVSPFSSRLIARVREGAIQTRIIRTGCINPCWRSSIVRMSSNVFKCV